MVDATELAEKGQFEKWDFLMVMKTLDYDMHAGQEPTKTLQLKCAAEYLVAELALLGNTVCHECSGFGHVAKDCPTRARLTFFASYGGTHASMIAAARGLVQRKYGHGLQTGGLKSSLSKTARCTPKKGK